MRCPFGAISTYFQWLKSHYFQVGYSVDKTTPLPLTVVNEEIYRDFILKMECILA